MSKNTKPCEMCDGLGKVLIHNSFVVTCSDCQGLGVEKIDTPLITTEASLRFRLECEVAKSEALLEENKELRSRIKELTSAKT